MSRQVTVMAGSKLVAVGMEKSEFGHDLGPRVVGKGKKESRLTQASDAFCFAYSSRDVKWVVICIGLNLSSCRRH